jgi:DnaJ domain
METMGESKDRELDDYYGLLHVQADAPVEIIRSSYRTLMQSLRNHPDLGGDHERAAMINAAYAVLTDPDKRAAYDRECLAAARAEPAGDDIPGAAGRGRCLFCGAPQKPDSELERFDACARCASPAYSASRHQLDRLGQRSLHRNDKRGPVAFFTRWPQAAPFRADMLDLSLNGMQLSSDVRLVQGQLIKIDADACRALGRVAYCRPAGNGRWSSGIEFVTLRFTQSRGSFVSARA